MKIYKYLWTNKYDEAQPNNGYSDEWDTQEMSDDYDFSDWLYDEICHGANGSGNYDIIDAERGEYIITDGGEEIGRYKVIGCERVTDEK